MLHENRLRFREAESVDLQVGGKEIQVQGFDQQALLLIAVVTGVVIVQLADFSAA